MPRQKEYNEADVIEKAMSLFWRNGYENTSVRMLEKEMGINQFSIYSSFGSKQGVFIESLKSYWKRLKVIMDKLENSNNGVEGIRQYFYDFLEFASVNEPCSGCLLNNTINELSNAPEPQIKAQVMNYVGEIQGLLLASLKQDKTKSKRMRERQADYLMISIMGLATAAKVAEPGQLEHYIETVFQNI